MELSDEELNSLHTLCEGLQIQDTHKYKRKTRRTPKNVHKLKHSVGEPSMEDIDRMYENMDKST